LRQFEPQSFWLFKVGGSVEKFTSIFFQGEENSTEWKFRRGAKGRRVYPIGTSPRTRLMSIAWILIDCGLSLVASMTAA
jgi:hypothetical protein